MRKWQGIIVHAMGEYIQGLFAPAFLEREGLSIHALITPEGSVIRMHTDSEVAFHAKGFNRTHLGVELLVPGEHDYESFLKAIKQPEWYHLAQWESAQKLCRQWCSRHNLKAHQVQGHSEVDPHRKYDPGAGFFMDTFRESLTNRLENG